MGLCLQLEQKQIPPPYRPRLESERDLANFPPEFTDEPVQLTPDDQYGFLLFFRIKVEKILKGSLDLIPSPSPSIKIQIMGGKVCLRCKGKTFKAF